MKSLTHNDVAAALARQVRERHMQAVAEMSKVRPAVFGQAPAQWKGEPVASPIDPLYDLVYTKAVDIWRTYGIRGQAANVTVIDSGCDISHPAFAHTEILRRSFIPWDLSDKDACGHGTWVCGKIVGAGVGMAPMCNLSCYRTLDANGSGTNDAAVAALTAVLKDGQADIVNMSFGSPEGSDAMKAVIDRLTKAGVIVVAAAGNYGLDAPFYPGSYPACLTVAATNASGCRASFSDYGGQIDIAAPGVATYSTYLNGAFRAMTGTSMATPVVTGMLALGVSYLKMVKGMTSKPDIAEKVMDALEATATDHAVKDQFLGFGIVDGMAFMGRVAS